MTEPTNAGRPGAEAVARAMIAAALRNGYLEAGEAVLSAPELAAAEKELFLRMFAELKRHLQQSGRAELSEDEIASLFNYAFGKGAEQAYNHLSGQKQEFDVAGMFQSRVALYVDDRLMNFLKTTPAAAVLGGVFLDFQNGNPGVEPILALFEALKWTLRIGTHLALKLMEHWSFRPQL